ELAHMLKHKNHGSTLVRELHNATTHQVREVLISIADRAPEVFVVLFPEGENASSGAVAGDASKEFLPKAGYLLPSTNEPGGKDRTFNGLDRTHRQRAVEIQINGTKFRVLVRCDLLFEIGRAHV